MKYLYTYIISCFVLFSFLSIGNISYAEESNSLETRETLSKEEVGLTLLPSHSENSLLAEKIHSGSLELYDIPGYIVHLLNSSVWIAYFLAMLSFMYVGVLYLKSMFDDSSDGEAKGRIPKIILGVCIVAFSWIFVDLILQITTWHVPR